MTKRIIRQYIRETFNMKCTITKHPFIVDGVIVGIPELGIGKGNVFPREVYEKNKDVFEYVTSLTGTILQSGERII